MPGRDDAAAEARVQWLAEQLDLVAPTTDDDLGHAADHRTARDELARARGEATAEGWAAAVGLWRSVDRPLEEAYCLFRQAECHLAEKRRDRAAAAASSAREIAQRLGAAPS